MAVKGVFTSDAGIVGDRKGDFTSGLLQTMPTGMVQFLALSSGMESADAQDTIVTWFEENHISGRVNVTNDATTGTTFTVDDNTIVVAGQVYLVESTGEYVFVEAVTGSDLTVARGFANTTITTLDGSVTAEPIQRIGTAHEEASSRPVAFRNLGYPRFNYMQIFRQTWDISRTSQEIAYYTGAAKAKSRRDAALFIAEDMERSLLFGKISKGVLNGRVFHTMDGIDSMTLTNIATGPTVTRVEMDDFVESIFDFNVVGKPNERIAFCGNTVLRVINEIVLEQTTAVRYNVEAKETSFGMKVNVWDTPFGSITLMTHPMYNENPIWRTQLNVIHPGAIRTRWLRRVSEDAYDRDGTRAGVDADYGVFTSEMTVELKAEVTSGKYTGMTTAA